MKEQDESQNLVGRSSRDAVALLVSNADERLEVSTTLRRSSAPGMRPQKQTRRPRSCICLNFTLNHGYYADAVKNFASIFALNTTRLVGNRLGTPSYAGIERRVTIATRRKESALETAVNGGDRRNNQWVGGRSVESTRPNGGYLGGKQRVVVQNTQSNDIQGPSHKKIDGG